MIECVLCHTRREYKTVSQKNNASPKQRMALGAHHKLKGRRRTSGTNCAAYSLRRVACILDFVCVIHQFQRSLRLQIHTVVRVPRILLAILKSLNSLDLGVKTQCFRHVSVRKRFKCFNASVTTSPS